MDLDRTRTISKRLSYVLRHHPESIRIELDGSGWVAIDVLLTGLAHNGLRLGPEELREVVETNDKQRFAFSEDAVRIRASQGHSVAVELGYRESSPPATRFHGTVPKFLDSIRGEGLIAGTRHHLHLSGDLETARAVGGRRGKPVVLMVRAGAMEPAGHQFFRSENGVWLVEHVPPGFLDSEPA